MFYLSSLYGSYIFPDNEPVMIYEGDRYLKEVDG